MAAAFKLSGRGYWTLDSDPGPRDIFIWNWEEDAFFEFNLEMFTVYWFDRWQRLTTTGRARDDSSVRLEPTLQFEPSSHLQIKYILSVPSLLGFAGGNLTHMHGRSCENPVRP